MPYRLRPWDSMDLEMKTAAIVRALGQYISAEFKKVLDKVMSGKPNFSHADWLWIVNTHFKDEHVKNMFTEWILRAWQKGYDLNKNFSFLRYFLTFAGVQFSLRIQDFSELTQLSMMGNLEPLDKKSKREKWEEEILW